MEFVQGLPKGVYVGQTGIQHPQTIATQNENLSGFNLALHVNDDAQRVQQHRMLLLNELSAFGVDKITWMTQTHSSICHTINEQIPFIALEGDGRLLAGMNEMNLEGAGLGGCLGGRAEEHHAADQEQGENRQAGLCEGSSTHSPRTAPDSAERRAAIMRCQQFNPRPKDYVPHLFQ